MSPCPADGAESSMLRSHARTAFGQLPAQAIATAVVAGFPPEWALQWMRSRTPMETLNAAHALDALYEGVSPSKSGTERNKVCFVALRRSLYRVTSTPTNRISCIPLRKMWGNTIYIAYEGGTPACLPWMIAQGYAFLACCAL